MITKWKKKKNIRNFLLWPVSSLFSFKSCFVSPQLTVNNTVNRNVYVKVLASFVSHIFMRSFFKSQSFCDLFIDWNARFFFIVDICEDIYDLIILWLIFFVDWNWNSHWNWNQENISLTKYFDGQQYQFIKWFVLINNVFFITAESSATFDNLSLGYFVSVKPRMQHIN